MTMARKTLIDDSEVTLLHCVSRCVRRAFLCGEDPYSGKNFDHRKDWVRDRLEFLTTVFGFEVFSYACLSNHVHVAGRTRPDLVEEWTAEEVAQRWARLYPNRDVDGRPEPPTEVWLTEFARDDARVAQARERLRSISWFMRCLNLIDTTGRCIRAAKRGAIDPACAPILQRLKLNPDTWLNTVLAYGKRFRRVAGDPVHLKAVATATGQKWLQGIRSGADSYQTTPKAA